MIIFRSALAACCFLFAANSPAQTDTSTAALAGIDHSPQATIAFDTGASLTTQSAEGLFGRVAARTNQAIAVQLQYPADLAGQAVLVQSFDGAQIIGGTAKSTVASDGTATVQLRLGPNEGVYRFVVISGDSHAVLRFYAIAPGHISPDSTLLVPSSGQ